MHPYPTTLLPLPNLVGLNGGALALISLSSSYTTQISSLSLMNNSVSRVQGRTFNVVVDVYQ